MNARFWIGWNGSPVKLTLKPGQELRCFRSWRHDEGWSSLYREWEHDGDEILHREIEDGTDCDGHITRAGYYFCDVRDLHRGSTVDGITYPAWELESRDINDRFARQAGY